MLLPFLLLAGAGVGVRSLGPVGLLLGMVGAMVAYGLVIGLISAVILVIERTR